MDKQTLSNYGWIVIVTLILAVMLALATPFGAFIGDGVVNVANGLVGASNNAMDEDNIKNKNEIWDAKLNNNYDYETGMLKLTKPKLKIEGNELIISAEKADTVTVYHNNTELQTLKDEFVISLQTHFYEDGTYNIGVKVSDSTGKYAPSDVEYIDYVIDTRERIPNGAIYIKGNDNMSKNLGYKSGYKTYTFNGKTLYIDNNDDYEILVAGDYFPQLEDGDIYCYEDFFYIYNYRAKATGDATAELGYLANVYGWSCIPFEDKATYTNPICKIQGATVRSMSCAFMAFENITTLPVLPQYIVDINSICARSTSITTVNYIPSSVVQMTSAFLRCSNLEGTIHIDIQQINNEQYVYAFTLTSKPITLVGASPNNILELLKSTANNNNVTIGTDKTPQASPHHCYVCSK